MMCSIFLYLVLFLVSPIFILLFLLFSYIFIAPLLCMWAFVFSLLGWKIPQELTKKWFPEMYYPKGMLAKVRKEK